MAHRLNLRAGIGARALLGLLLLVVHLLAAQRLAADLGAWKERRAQAPRLQVVYLREMTLTDPPVQSSIYRISPPRPLAPLIEPWQLPPADAAAITFAAQAASAPAIEAPGNPQSDNPPEPLLAKADVPAESASDPTTEPAGSDHAKRSANSDTDQPADFVWPASTRLSYALTGSYRGEVNGWAQVEWINAEPRYQVNLDVTVGLPFAPLYKREMRSDGQLGRGGLQPRHFQQQSKLAFSPMHQVSLSINGTAVTADDGRMLPASFASTDVKRQSDYQTGLQDSASQFVQMTYLFTTQPQLLTPGTRVGFPLVLPSGVRDWAYEVGQKETVYTQFGAIEAFHVKSAAGLSRGRDQLLAEAWFAPRLAYLPVRLRIEQHADLYLDMVLERIPELAAP